MKAKRINDQIKKKTFLQSNSERKPSISLEAKPIVTNVRIFQKFCPFLLQNQMLIFPWNMDILSINKIEFYTNVNKLRLTLMFCDFSTAQKAQNLPILLN